MSVRLTPRQREILLLALCYGFEITELGRTAVASVWNETFVTEKAGGW